MAYNQFAAIAEETVWGTPVARTKFMKVHEGSFLEHVADREVATIMSGNIGADAEAVFDKGQRGEGTLILPSSFDDIGMMTLLKHGFGLYAVTGAGPFVHTFTRKTGPPFAAGTVPTAQSMSVELNYELSDTGLQARLLEGAMVKTVGLSWAAQEEVKGTFELIGEQVTQVVETASPTFPAYDLYLQKFSQASIKFDAGAEMNAIVTGFDFKLDNVVNPLVTLGSTTTRQPKRSGKADITGTIKMLWDGTASQAAAMWAKYKANTAASIVVIIQGPTNYLWTFTLNNVRYTTSKLTPMEGQLQPVEFEYRALHDPTLTAARLTVSNQTASV
jgi:hypothetical protein